MQYLMIFLMVLTSCTETYFNAAGDYIKFIENPKNGLKISKSYSEIEFIAKYLPVELKVLKELEEKCDYQSYDSLHSIYLGSHYFIFSIAPGKNCPVDDLNYYEIHNQDEFAERKWYLNYSFNEQFILNIGGKEFFPKLFHHEQDYGMKGTLIFHLIFIPSENTKEKTRKINKMLLQFDDPIFNTGHSEFVFKGKFLRKIPPFKLKIMNNEQ